ncbi:MAG TPA: glycosyltransferase [Abditibacteriaceae bacterium]|nr:glycosyltransferase [Abditibacteriaceae bacterium]
MSAQNFPDLIFVSLENWDHIWRRNQFLCASLARRFPDLKILFVGPVWDAVHYLRRRDVQALRRPKIWSVADFPNITVTRAWKLLPNSLPGARRFNEGVMRRHVRAAAGHIGIKQPILWLNPHHAVHMVGRMNERAVIYDITDDWALASGSPTKKQLVEKQDRQSCQAADLVVVCSEALEQSRRELCKNILLLPNGVDVTHYKNVATSPGHKPSSWPSPVFGYTGTLHSDRVDSTIVLALARAFPQGSVVLVGPGRLASADRHALESEKNVHLPGAVPYQQIPHVMAQFDVCITPHLETEFTESLNPIKLWEYLAAGKPIVSTNVAGFRSYSHLCHIASGPQAFIEACRLALQENGDKKAARIAEAARHSWESRVDRLLEALQCIGIK